MKILCIQLIYSALKSPSSYAVFTETFFAILSITCGTAEEKPDNIGHLFFS